MRSFLQSSHPQCLLEAAVPVTVVLVLKHVLSMLGTGGAMHAVPTRTRLSLCSPSIPSVVSCFPSQLYCFSLLSFHRSLTSGSYSGIVSL